MVDFKETLSEVSDTVEWYYKFSTAASIDNLMEKRDNLSCNYFYLTDELAESIKDYKQGEKEIETGITRDKIILEKTYATNKARDLAKNSYKSKIECLATTEAMVKKIEKILKAVEFVLQAMQQRISWERMQWEYQKNLDNYQKN